MNIQLERGKPVELLTAAHNVPMELTVDPNKAYTDKTEQQVINWCGYLPQFAAQADDATPFDVVMEAHYGFPLSYLDRAGVDDDGIYHYPGDMPLEPLMKITHVNREEHLFIYPYGLVSFIYPDGTQKHTRMD